MGSIEYKIYILLISFMSCGSLSFVTTDGDFQMTVFGGMNATLEPGATDDIQTV